MTQQTEHELPGGGLTRVVRIGDTVRRPMRPWSLGVHALLGHLRACGFTGCPEVLGIDAQNREVLRYIEAEAGLEPITAEVASDRALAEYARLIRAFHDASATFPLAGETWQTILQDPSGRPEIICHNDLGPANAIYRQGRPIALIDWDLAAPGSRLWDLAYAIWWLVPIHHPAFMRKAGWPSIDEARRLALFVDAYELGVEDRRRLLPVLHERQLRNQMQLRSYVAEGVIPPYDPTDPAVECGNTTYADARREFLQAALGVGFR